MEITKTISAVFVTSSIGYKNTYSGKTIIGDFTYALIVTKRDGNLGAFVQCLPLQSTKEWMCITAFSLTEESSGTMKNIEMTKKFSNINDDGWGEDNFMLWEELAGKKYLILEAKITIVDSYLGPPDVFETKSNKVIFHRLAKDFLSDKPKTSKHQAIDSTWIIEGQETDNGMKFMVKKYNKEGKLESNLPSGAVVISLRGPTSIETKFGDLGKYICFGNQTNEDSDVTFLVHDQPFPCHAEVRKGVNYGREYLSIQTHGNVSFSLNDNSKIPLSSYILAENSPVLKSIIEKEGELDRDVSDFHPKSVRIFVNACYNGALEMSSDTTEYKVFCDVVKMVAVFKVDWAKGGCIEFFRKNLPEPSEDFKAYWDYALLALDLAIQHGNASYLEHLLSCTPKNYPMFRFQFFPLVFEMTNRSHFDLAMAMIVEFGFVENFLENVLTLLMVKHEIPLLNYWLNNFNFSLCEEETFPLLIKAIEPITSSEVCSKFIKIRDECELTYDEMVDKDSDMIKREPLPNDGTLATVARNHWATIVSSTWPCSEERPFSLARTKLWGKEEIIDVKEEIAIEAFEGA
eukprot:sb/3463417/